MQNRSNRNQSGTTLIETMIATVICVVAVFALAGLISMATRQSKEMGTTVAQCTALAAQKMDQLLGAPFTDAQLTCASPPCGSVTSDVTGFVEYLREGGGATTAGAADLVFTRRWYVETSTTTGLPNTIKRMTVWVGGRAIGPTSDASRPSAILTCLKAQL